MNPIRFRGVNVNYNAPAGWDPDKDGPCDVLPVMKFQDDHGHTVCSSVWDLTPEERAAVAAGANICLQIVGGQAPVSLIVVPMNANDGSDSKEAVAQP